MVLPTPHPLPDPRTQMPNSSQPDHTCRHSAAHLFRRCLINTIRCCAGGATRSPATFQGFDHQLESPPRSTPAHTRGPEKNLPVAQRAEVLVGEWVPADHVPPLFAPPVVRVRQRGVLGMEEEAGAAAALVVHREKGKVPAVSGWLIFLKGNIERPPV